MPCGPAAWGVVLFGIIVRDVFDTQRWTCQYGGESVHFEWGIEAVVHADGVRMERRPIGWDNAGIPASDPDLDLRCSSTLHLGCSANWNSEGCGPSFAIVAFEIEELQPSIKGWMRVQYDLAAESLVIREWYYEDSGAPIKVGDTGVVPSQIYPTIRSAIDAATDGDVIRIAPGVYNEAINFRGKSIVLEGSVSDPSIVTLSGTGLFGSVVAFASEEGRDSVLRGVTIASGTRGTSLPGQPASSPKYGGGILMWEASPTIEHCRLEENRSDFGGAVYVGFGSPVFRDCVFMQNEAMVSGGGLMADRTSSLELESCEFEGNRAAHFGAGMLLLEGSMVADECVLSENVVSRSGLGGGAIAVGGSVSSLLVARHATVSGNTAPSGGGVMIDGPGSVVFISDSAMCGNQSGQIEGPWTDLGGNCVAERCSGGESCGTCLGDLDGDGVVGGSDLGAWLVSFGESCDPDESCPGDFDGDGEVRGGDLGILLAAWGVCP
jgi:hypothetical protein